MILEDIALVGMACTFPHAVDLSRFWFNLVNGISLWEPAAAPETKADSLAGDSAQHVLLGVIQQALHDAEVALQDVPARAVRLLVGHEPRAMHGAGCPQHLDATLGAGVTAECIEAAEVSSLRALARGVQALRQGQCDVLVFAVMHALETPAGQVEAVAVVLERQTAAIKAGRGIYALLKGMAIRSDDSLQQVYKDANLRPEDIGLLELPGYRSTSAGYTQQFSAIQEVFGSRSAHRVLRPMAMLAAQANLTRPTLGLAALVKTALCLSNKLIPPTVCPTSETHLAELEQLPFFLNIELRPWIHDVAQLPRRAAVQVCDAAGEVSHVILEENTPAVHATPVRSRPVKTVPVWDSEVVVFGADTAAALVTQVERLQALLQTLPADVTLADVAYTQSRQFHPQSRYRLALVCPTLHELQHHLKLCQQRFGTAAPHFDDLSGVYYTAQGDQVPGKIAWLFPGLGFPGLLGPYAEHLRELCIHFPEVREVFDLVDARDRHPADPTPTNQICFPPANFSEPEQQRLRRRLASPRVGDAAIMEHPEARNLSPFGVAVANWSSYCLLQKLGVPMDMVFGQSYGEMSALCAAGVLDFPQVIAVHWQIELTAEYVSGRGRLALVSASQEGLAPFLARFPTVDIAIHVSPQLQILGGEASQLERLLADVHQVGIWTQLLPYPAIHTPHFTSLRPAIHPHLENISVHPACVPVYSGMLAAVYPQEPEALRQTMIANLDHPVRLWQTTQQMYQDGARIFIQVGGGANMSTHAKTNIGAADVLSVSLNVEHQSAIAQLNHLCAALVTHGVPVNLAHLYEYRSLRALSFPAIEAASRKHASTASAVRLSATSPPSDTPSERPQVGTPVSDEPRMPFIGKVLHHVPGQELVLERVLDLHEDLFLAHHVFVMATEVKPVSACLPVVPMTVSMEVLAEVAAGLAPGCGLIGFEEVKATRWIVCEDQDTLALRVSARVHQYDAATGTYRIAAGLYTPGKDTPAVQAVVLLGQRYCVSLDLSFPAPQHLRRYPYTPQQIYQERQLFHGPVFQCLAGDVILAERTVIGELEVLPKDRMFRSTRRPALLTDPILLDGVGQLIGLWAMQQGGYVFPIRLRKLECYGTTPAVGTRVPVYITITQYTSRLLSANVEIQDGAGRVWMRLDHWGDWVFHWPRKIYDFRRQPTQFCASHILPGPSLGAHAVGHYMTTADLHDTELQTMARFYLHLDEMPQFRQLAHMPTQQRQWLLGRMVAKDAVRGWLAQQHQTTMLHPAAFVLTDDSTDHLRVKAIPGVVTVPRLCVAFADDYTMAVAHAVSRGVAIKRVVEDEAHAMERCLTSRERDHLARFTGSAYHPWLTRLWCAKAAVARYLDTDMHGAPHTLDVLEVHTDGTVIVQHHSSGQTIVVYTTQAHECIVAGTIGTPRTVEQRYGAC